MEKCCGFQPQFGLQVTEFAPDRGIYGLRFKVDPEKVVIQPASRRVGQPVHVMLRQSRLRLRQIGCGP